MAHLEHTPASPRSCVLLCALHFAAAGDLRRLQAARAAPVGVIQDTAGVSPLLFFNALPAYRPGVQVALLDVWFGVTILYFTAGSLILAAAWRRPEHPLERRRLGSLCFAVLFFGVVV